MTEFSLRLRSVAAIVTAMAALTGCMHEEAGECPGEMKQPTMILNLSVDTGIQQSRETRSDAPDDFEGADKNTNFEKINQLRVIIVHELNETKTEGLVEANRLVATTDEGYPMYDNLEFEVVADETKRIYLIANEASLPAPKEFRPAGVANPTATRFLDTLKPDKEKTVDLSILAEWTAEMPEAENGLVRSGIFAPANLASRLPLTEYFDVYADRNSTVDDIFYANLFVTRAAAKATFYVEATAPMNENAVYSTITGIRLNGIGTTEYVFPNNTVYNPDKESLIKDDKDKKDKIEEAYITAFNVPQDAQKVTYLLGNLNAPVRGTKHRITSSSIYFPESILEPGEHYTVSVQLDNGSWLEPAPLENNILSFDGKDAIARSTDLQILIRFTGEAQITAEVLPWDRQDYYVDYIDNVGFTDNGYLDLTGYNITNNPNLYSTGELIISYNETIEGSFNISTPRGGTWTAYLNYIEGENGTMEFFDPTTGNSLGQSISGQVGTPANFAFHAKSPAGAANNVYELQVIVFLADGTPVVANVIENGKFQDTPRTSLLITQSGTGI